MVVHFGNSKIVYAGQLSRRILHKSQASQPKKIQFIHFVQVDRRKAFRYYIHMNGKSSERIEKSGKEKTNVNNFEDRQSWKEPVTEYKAGIKDWEREKVIVCSIRMAKKETLNGKQNEKSEISAQAKR